MYREKKKGIESCKRERSNHIQRQNHKNNSLLFSRCYGNQKGLYACSTDDERPRLLYPAKLPVLSKDKERLSIIKKKKI